MSGLFGTRTILDEVRAEDADELVAVHADAFARSWSADDFAALIADRTVFALALRRQGWLGRRRMIGFVLIRAVAGEAEILTVAVAPAERGLGLGRLLVLPPAFSRSIRRTSRRWGFIARWDSR